VWTGFTDGKLVVPGIMNQPEGAYLLADTSKAALQVSRQDDAILIGLKGAAPDPNDSVVVLEVAGNSDVSDPPVIESEFDSFVDSIDVRLKSDRENVQVRYTLDGSAPDARSPIATGKITLSASSVVSARCFRGGTAVSGTVQREFKKASPRAPEKAGAGQPGIRYAYFEGDWDALPNFRVLPKTREGVVPGFQLSPRLRPERIGFEFAGYFRVPADDVYAFYTESDDGSRLYIGDTLVVDNDGLHGSLEKQGTIALAAGLHPIRVLYFNKTGGMGLNVNYASGRIKKQPVPEALLFHR
jgi:hypothetical protein